MAQETGQEPERIECNPGELPAGVVMFNSGRDEFLEKKIGGKRGRGEEPMLRARFFAQAFHQSWVR
jgi:hypothetical protein